MKKLYLVSGVLVLLAIGYYLYVKNKDKKDKENNKVIESDTVTVSGISEVPKINVTGTAATNEVKYYDVDDSEARKAIEKRMSVLHSKNWKDIFRTAQIGDFFKGVAPKFKAFVLSNITKQGWNDNYIRLGYTDEYFAKLAQFEGLRSITGENKNQQLQEDAINDFIVNRADLSELGGADFRSDTQTMRNCIDAFGGDRWGVMENWRVLGVNLKKESLKYRDSLQEQAIQDLIKSGWHFYGY